MTFPLLLTNDDGIHSPGLQELASSLNGRGHPLVVLAPLSEQSAVGMKLTLRDDMAFQEHIEIADRIRVKVPEMPAWGCSGRAGFWALYFETGVIKYIFELA